MKKVLNYFNGFEWFLLIGMIIANVITGGFGNVVGAICSITGVLCVLLVAKGKISNYVFGLINVALYAYLSYINKFYGDFMLNAFYYVPTQFIGFYMWKKNMSGEKTVKAKKMNSKQFVLMAVLCAAAVFGYAQFLRTLGGNSIYLDSTSTVLSVIAQILMLLMFAEQWILWIIVNIVSTIMWLIPAATGDAAAISMAIMWFVYLINAVYGYWNWRKMAKEIEIEKEISDAAAEACPYKLEPNE